MPTLFEDIDGQITKELEGRCILGVTVCVRADDGRGGVLYINAHNSPDAKPETVLNEGDLFLIASQSKTFASVAALSLIDRGFLSLNDKLINRLPDLQNHPDHSMLANITVQDLLKHQAPLDWRGEMYAAWDTDKSYPTVTEISGKDLFSMLNPHRLKEKMVEPYYSNTGYALLGAIIERVARENKLGSSFGDFVQKNILEPNELDEIHPGLSDVEIGTAKNIAQGYYYMLKDGPLEPSLKPSLLACTPSGGFYGTAAQVSKFYHLLLSGRLLLSDELSPDKRFTKSSLEIMKECASEYAEKYPEKDPFGMGLSRYKDGSFGQDGLMTGYNNRTVHRDGVTISIMSNLCTLSEAYKPTPKDIDEPLFPKIVSIVRNAIAKPAPQPRLYFMNTRAKLRNGEPGGVN